MRARAIVCNMHVLQVPALARWLPVIAVLMCAGCTRKAAFETPEPKVRSGSSKRAAVANTRFALPGMVRIKRGTVAFGTPRDAVPRVAEEEPIAEPREVAPFDIDELPFPNERGAMPRTNVNRAEAEELCAATGKRLCTATEWERACKGDGQNTYPWGNDYHSEPCALERPLQVRSKTGVVSFTGLPPVGERKACSTQSGVRELVGGAWEWTSTGWNRGSVDPALGVLKGGNASDGPLVGRCANGLGRPHKLRYADVSFRCCRSVVEEDEGPSSENMQDASSSAEAPSGNAPQEADASATGAQPHQAGRPNAGAEGRVEPGASEPIFVRAKGLPGLTHLTVDEALKGVSDGGAAVVRGALGGETARVEDAWRWTPVAGDSLLLLALCDAQGCGIAALHTDGASLSVRLRERTGPHPPGAVRDNDAAVLWVHPHAGPKVPVRILHYREGRVLLRRPQDVVHRAD